MSEPFRCTPDESAGMAEELERRASERADAHEAFAAFSREANLRDPAAWPSIVEASKMLRERISRAWRRAT